MKNINLRVLLSAIALASVMATFTKIEAGPVRFNQVVQIVNARPGKAETGTFSRLRVSGDYTSIISDDDDDDKKKKDAQTQDDKRVITETKSDIVEDDTCDCVEDTVETRRGFPKWYLLGLAAIPVAFILIHHKKETPTPTGSIPITQTPTPGTPTPTPPVTPTPTPHEPVPEPMTILLFGTGLASIGLAARRRFGKKEDGEGEDES